MIIFQINYLAEISIARNIAGTTAAWIGVASDKRFTQAEVTEGAA